MSLDIKNFYLNTPLKRYEYLKFKLTNFQGDVSKQYILRDKATSEVFVYIVVRKGMYGLPQAGLLVQELLEKILEAHGYRQSKLTPGFWEHDTRPILFSLVVDDFGVKYVREEHADHLNMVLKKNYDISTDEEGTKYCGLTLDWDYENQQVHLSIPGYVEKALQRFKHDHPKKPQDQPHQHVIPTHGAKVQYAQAKDQSGYVIEKLSNNFDGYDDRSQRIWLIISQSTTAAFTIN